MHGVDVVSASIGLAGAAGLNAWLPLLAYAVAARTGAVDLAEHYSVLAKDPVLVVLAVGTVLDFVGDKVPGVDHALHVAGTVVHPVSGALLAAGQGSGDISEPLALLGGGGLAGAFHLGRAGLRPLSTAFTGGAGNPVLSLVEDVVSGVLLVLALLVPVLAAVAVLAVAILLVAGLLRLRAAGRLRSMRA